MSFQALDGETVQTDSLLWVDQSTDPPRVVGKSEGQGGQTLKMGAMRGKRENEGQGGQLVVGEALSALQQAEVRAVLLEHRSIFEAQLLPGGAHVEPMTVEMREGWNPNQLQPMRRYAPAVAAAMQEELEAQIKGGVVELSDAPSGAPVHMVRKEDSLSGYRFCIDFSTVNKDVMADPYPLPSVQTILDYAAGAHFFAKFDLRKGYWQFPVDPDHRFKLAFQIQAKVYQ